MAGYPESFIEEVRERADLLEIVSRQISLKKSGGNWFGMCPFHHEKTPSFSVRPDKGFFKCFSCGKGGDAFTFLMETKGLDFIGALEEAAEVTGIPLPAKGAVDPERERKREERKRLIDLMEEAQRFFREQLDGPRGGPAREYLEKRGLSRETIDRFGVGFAPPGWDSLLNHLGGGAAAGKNLERAGLAIPRKGEQGGHYDRYRNRITFPIRDLKGKCVGFGGRVVNPEDEPKYINSPETELYQKSEILYGLDKSQEEIRKEGAAVVVEGYMDAIALAEAGVGHVAATLGTSLTDRHLRMLWQRTNRIVFCFDGDPAGKKAAWRSLEMVLDGMESDRHPGFLFLPEGQDPDDVIRAEGVEGFRQRLAAPVSLPDFLFQEVSGDLEVETAQGRAAAAKRLRPYLARIGDALLRDLYAEELGDKLGLSLGQVLPDMPYQPQPKWKKPAAAPRPPGEIEGRDTEQALLALALRRPHLVREHEEELGRLAFQDPEKGELLGALLQLDQGLEEPPEAWLLETLERPNLLEKSRLILAREGEWVTVMEEEGILPTFLGCLTALQNRRTKARERELHQEFAREGQGKKEKLAFLQEITALARERERLHQERNAGGGDDPEEQAEDAQDNHQSTKQRDG